MTPARPHAVTGTSARRVVRATARDAEQLTAVIAAAFHPIAPCRALFPDEQQRRRLLPRLLHIGVQDALERGTVHTTEDRAGAALWFPRGQGGHRPPPDYGARLVEAVGQHAPRVRRYGELVEAGHPAEPHDYLWVLAVAPDRQGRGIGSLLLDAHHRDLDRRGRAGYLEACDWDTRAWYLAQGYGDMSPPRIALAELADTSLHRMWREPAPPPAEAAADASAWTPVREERVRVRAGVQGWAGRTGTVISSGSPPVDRPYCVAIDGETDALPDEKRFALRELEPVAPDGDPC